MEKGSYTVMTNDEKRSRLYSYFYGKNVVFQLILIFISVLMFLMIALTLNAPGMKVDRLRDKRDERSDEMRQAQMDYAEYYYNLDVDDMKYGSPFELNRKDEYYKEKKEHNKLLEEFWDAEDKYERADEKYEEANLKKRESEPFMDDVYKILGIIILVFALLWLFYKKFIQRDTATEKLYDEELQRKIAEVKGHALEKLNILSEQVEQVDPVVLNGMADVDEGLSLVSKKSKSKRLYALLAFLKFMLPFAAVGAVLYLMIFLTSIGFPIAIQHILVFLISGGVGFLAFSKFELEAHINPRTIDKLDKLPPRLLTRIGMDGQLRVTLPSITVYMFGDEQLYIYYQYFNIITGKIFCEGVHEYFYEDIVGVVSAQDKKLAFRRHGFLNLFLQTVPYLKESISVVSSGCTHREAYFVDMGCSLLDTQFTAMRNLIRQKKEEK